MHLVAVVLIGLIALTSAAVPCMNATVRWRPSRPHGSAVPILDSSHQSGLTFSTTDDGSHSRVPQPKENATPAAPFPQEAKERTTALSAPEGAKESTTTRAPKERTPATGNEQTTAQPSKDKLESFAVKRVGGPSCILALMLLLTLFQLCQLCL